MYWWQAVIILLSYLLILISVAIFNLQVLQKVFGYAYWISQVALLIPMAILILILSKTFRISYSHRIKTPKLKEIILVLGVAILAVFIFKPFGFPKEYYYSIFCGVPNIQLPGNETTKIVNIQFLFFGCLLFPILEEILFREILVRKLIINYSVVGVVVIISIIFGSLHFSPSFMAIFLLSVTITYIYLISDSLVLVIVFHCIYNMMVVVSSYLHTTTGNFFFTIWYLLSTIIGIILMIKLLNELRKYTGKIKTDIAT
jgi:membrane protease YdiL (CAAX protease family)